MSVEAYQPVGRRGHIIRLVKDNLSSKLCLWGGIHYAEDKATCCANVMEKLSLSTGEWYKRHTTGNPPLGVWDYAAATMGDAVFYFGGLDIDAKRCHNSLYRCMISSSSNSYYDELPKNEWKELSPTTSDDGPMMKSNCGMIALRVGSEDYLAIIGGTGPSSNNTPPQPGAQYSGKGLISGFQRCNEIHLYRLRHGNWESPSVTGDRPPPISGFTLSAIDYSTGILFGGIVDGENSSDVYIFEFTHSSVNCKKFSNPGGSVQWPKERQFHSSVLINCSLGPHLLVVGGSTIADSWMLNIKKMKWEQLFNIPANVTERYFHSLSVWSETPNTYWIIVFGGWRKLSAISDTTFIEIITSNGDLVVQSVLDINEYQKRRKTAKSTGETETQLAKVEITQVNEPSSDKDILDMKPRQSDLQRLFEDSASHYSTIGTALDVKVDDLLHSQRSASDNLMLVFQRWFDANKGVTWRNVLQICEDYPDKFGKTKADVEGFLSSDRARDNYFNY